MRHRRPGAADDDQARPNQPAPFLSGKPFNRCTHTALSPKGEIYVSDGYGNSRVQLQYSPDGKHLMCWGTTGTDPGEFNIALQHRHRRGWLGLCRRPREPSACRCSTATASTRPSGTTCTGACALYCCGGAKNPTFIIGELGPRMPVNTSTPISAPRLSIVDSRGKTLARLGGQDGPAMRPAVPRRRTALAVDSRGDIYVGEVSYTNWPAPSPAARAEIPALAAGLLRKVV